MLMQAILVYGKSSKGDNAMEANTHTTTRPHHRRRERESKQKLQRECRKREKKINFIALFFVVV